MLTRRHFIGSLTGSVAAASAATVVADRALGVVAFGAEADKPAPLPQKISPPGIPTIQIQTQDSVSIVWGVASLCSGWVEYGDTEQLGMVARGARLGRCPVENEVIQISLTGLKAGQKIYYRTVTALLAMPGNYALRAGEAIVSPVYSFTLPAGDAKNFKLAVWNDTHAQAKTLVALRQATAEYGPDLLLLNGDMVKGNFHTEEQIGDIFLRDTIGVATTEWPVLISRGNHDGYGPLANHLPRFAQPQHPDGYYQLLRLGPLALLMLDTGTDKEDDAEILHGTGAYEPYRKLQQQWLERIVTDPRFTTAPYRLLCCHIPLRWKEEDKNKDARCDNGDRLWSPILIRARVQAVVSGHTHRFWHSEPTTDRPYHQVVGGGPETISTQWSPTPATLTEITVDSDQLHLRVVEASSGKEWLNLKLSPLV